MLLSKKYILLLLCLFFYYNNQAQKGKPNAANGGVFTPKGTLRVLVVFVTYKDNSKANVRFENKHYDLPKWKNRNESNLPDFVDPITGDCPQFIFNKESDFDTYIDSVKHNYSKTFYLMSKGKFKLIGELFEDAKGRPAVVEIDPTDGYSWVQMNGRAIEAMKKINPKFDFSRFDLRKNSPNFRFDNSDTSQHKPDGIVDFTVFVHRYTTSWKEAPTKGMKGWIGSGGGFAATGIHHTNTIGKYRFADGFTMTYHSGVFVHELAHVLFNAPHIMGVNNVVGDYFYLPSAGWGIMAPISIFGGFNAWERWYSGFVDLAVDIKNVEDLKKGGDTFILKDYYTTGDAARIEIPFSDGQHLWLENHTKIHPLDEHPWKGSVLGHGDTLAGSAKGIYAYIEAIAGSRNEIFSPLSHRANGIKILHAGGNYDYYLYEELPTIKNAWGNPMKSFKKGESNPISGLNNLYRFPFDANKDGEIKIDRNYNASKTEWMIPVFREKNERDSFVNYYGSFGVYDAKKSNGYLQPIPFRAGDYLDLNSNPLPLNYPKYNMQKKELEPYYLNGLGLKFMEIENSNNIKVKVSYNRVQLCYNRRWTGNIVLPNITEDTKPDLEIGSCATLTLDRSNTTNRHLMTEQGDFINATVFRIKKGATMVIKSKGKVVIKDNTKFVIEKGGKLILEKKARLIIKAKAKLIGDTADIYIGKGAKIKK